jgi:hypothetical protein
LLARDHVRSQRGQFVGGDAILGAQHSRAVEVLVLGEQPPERVALDGPEAAIVESERAPGFDGAHEVAAGERAAELQPQARAPGGNSVRCGCCFHKFTSLTHRVVQ